GIVLAATVFLTPKLPDALHILKQIRLFQAALEMLIPISFVCIFTFAHYQIFPSSMLWPTMNELTYAKRCFTAAVGTYIIIAATSTAFIWVHTGIEILNIVIEILEELRKYSPGMQTAVIDNPWDFVKVYRQLTILVTDINNVAKHVLTLVQAYCVQEVVLGIYLSIRSPNHIFRLGLLYRAVNSFQIIISVFTKLGYVYEHSTDALMSLSMSSNSPIMKRYARSLQSVKIKHGDLFFADKELVRTTVLSIVDNLISLLLTF
ncbi:unnamed protein product, partial [Allacma fusca]